VVLGASAVFGPRGWTARGPGAAAALAFVITFVPPLIGHFSRLHAPRAPELAWVRGVVGISDALDLYERILFVESSSTPRRASW
jgi:hypothetical protein